MRILKNYSLIEILSSFFLFFIIIIISVYGIKLSFKLNVQLNNLKIAGNVLFDVAEKIKEMDYDLIINEVEISKNFNNSPFKPLYLIELLNGKIDVKINEPDGRNAGIKKIIIQIYWTENEEIKSLFPVAIFKSKTKK